MPQPLFNFSAKDIERLAEICRQNCDLTLEALQLGKVTLNALARARVHAIAGLPAVWAATPALGHDLGKTAPSVLQRLGEALLLHTDASGVIDWVKYCQYRDLPPPETALGAQKVSSDIKVAADLPALLSASTGSRQAGAALHFSVRTINALSEAGIATVAGLTTAAVAGLGKLKGIGAKSKLELAESLRCLPLALDVAGNLDQIVYARERGFPILPSNESYANPSLWLESISSVAADAVQACFDDEEGEGYSIFVRRYGLNGHPKLTLQEIGDDLDLTRQRICQLQERVVAMLGSAMRLDDYADKPIVFRPDFCAPLRAIDQQLVNTSYRFWRESDLITVAAETLCVAESQVRPALELLADLLGLNQRMLKPDRFEPLYARTDEAEIKRACGIVEAIDRELSAEPEGLDCYQVAALLNGKWPDLCTPGNVGEWVRLCPTAESAVDGRFRCKFSWLRNYGDKAFLVLLEAGNPLHFDALTEEINRRQLDRGREGTSYGVRAWLQTDARFQPVGRTGLWKLAAWDHIDGRSFVDIALEALREGDRPLHVDQLFDYLSQRRPKVRQASISTLLSNDGRFSRVAPSVWALTAWDPERLGRISPSLLRSSRDNVETILIDLLEDAPNHKLLLREAVRHLVNTTGLSEGMAYRRVRDCASVQVTDLPADRGKELSLSTPRPIV